MKVTEVYIVVDKSCYDVDYRRYIIADIKEVYLTEDAAKERVKELGWGHECVKRTVR